MIRQRVLPFKVEATRETLTAHAGLALLGEFAVGLGILEGVDRQLPEPGSGVGYRPSEYVLPLLLMLNGGGRSLEDTREIREDGGLREVLGMERVPSADATGDWLRRTGATGGGVGLQGVNRGMLKRGMKYDGRKGYTLDMDATGILAEKESAKMTYKGFRGYMPMVGHLAENGLVVGEEFRAGNVAPASRNLGFLQHCEEQMPKGKRIEALRCDSAAYQAEIFNYCEREGIGFAIGADLDRAVLAAIGGIAEGDWRPYRGGEIAETVHSMEKTQAAFRLIVVRRPYQGRLFGDEDASVKYTVMASNREESAEWVMDWYNQRGDSSENRIKELKIGFGMERMPCGQLEANGVFFKIGVLSYNIYKLFILSILSTSWHRHQVQTVRWRLYQVAGKVVYHGGRIYLKVKRSFCGIFKDIRLRIWEFANS